MSSSHSTTPKLQISARLSTTFRRACKTTAPCRPNPQEFVGNFDAADASFHYPSRGEPQEIGEVCPTIQELSGPVPLKTRTKGGKQLVLLGEFAPYAFGTLVLFPVLIRMPVRLILEWERRRPMKKLALVLALGVVWAHADTVYTYTGNPDTYCYGAYSSTWGVCQQPAPSLSLTFDTTLSGSQLDNLTLSGGDITATLQSYTFSDGNGVEITQANDTTLIVDIATDSNGTPIQWFINANALIGAGPYYYSACTSTGTPQCSAYPSSYIEDSSELVQEDVGPINQGLIYNNPGKWTVTTTLDPSSTPEPSSYLPLGAGLLLLALAARKRLTSSLSR